MKKIDYHHIDTDILVIGAGSAGCCAAIAAALHSDLNVLIIERYGFAGGTSTQMLDTFYGFFTPGDCPQKIVGGIPDIVVNRLHDQGEIFLRPNTYGAGTGINYNPERLKFVWDQLIMESGAKYLLHTTLIDAQHNADETYECICWSKGGFLKISTRKIIDASGDADFCHFVGLDYEIAGEKEPAQSMTTTFRMANVDLEVFEKEGGKGLLRKLMAATDHPLPRKEGSAHEMNIPKSISTVAVKVTHQSGLNNFSLTAAEIEGRRQAFIFEEFFRKEVPGYENSKISGLSTQIGVRETRRVIGNHILTKEECLLASIPDDTILLCGAPIEDHRNGLSETYWEYIPGSGIYGVGYGTIVPKKSNHVWVVGRCFSATHDAHASCRSMGQTMSMGQAAGLAAVQSLKENRSASEVDVSRLQNKLSELGAILQPTGKIASTGRNDWVLNIYTK